MASSAAAAPPSSFTQLLGTEPLLGPGGKSIPVNSLAGAPFAIYFSAHWCPPCKMFTPMLVKFFKNMQASGRECPIIFASSDRSKPEFESYYSSMPWYALPYGDKRKEKLAAKYKVRGIPTLVVVDGDGTTITTDARGNVMEDPQGADFPWKPKSLFEILDEGTKFVKPDGSASSVNVAGLRKLDAVAIYFSAHWCGPCRGFTPKLIKTYNQLVGDKKKFELIFASSDRDAKSFGEYHGTMPWPALPFGDKRKAELSKLFNVEGIPTLVIIDPKTGETITNKGRAAVSTDPKGENFPWRPEAATPLDEEINGSAMLVYLFDDVDDFEQADKTKAALIEVARTYKEEWAKAGTDPPLLFQYGDDDVDLTIPVRQFLGLQHMPSPTVLIADLPKRVKYMYTGKGFPTAAELRSFAEAFLANKLTSTDAKSPPKY